jgi:hypothetical protein
MAVKFIDCKNIFTAYRRKKKPLHKYHRNWCIRTINLR